jgi:hypothetical protein
MYVNVHIVLCGLILILDTNAVLISVLGTEPVTDTITGHALHFLEFPYVTELNNWISPPTFSLYFP